MQSTFSSYLVRNALLLYYNSQPVDICRGIVTVVCAKSKVIQNYYERNMQSFYNVTYGGITNYVIWRFHILYILQTT
jgi:hypothetical protein